MSVTVAYSLQLTVNETLTAAPDAASQVIVHKDYNKAGYLTSLTTPPVTKVSSFLAALTAGAKTIDLRTLTAAGGVALDGNGLKVQCVKINNPSTNTGALTVVPGASNGYNLFGATSKLVLNPGEYIEWVGYDALPDIDATHKTIDLTGTGTESSEWVIVLG
jgi:hypothetical protein